MTFRFISKQIIKLICNIASAIGVAWTVLEIVGRYYPDTLSLEREKTIIIYSAVIFAALHFVYCIYEVLFFTCRLDNREAIIKVRYGNLLKKKKGMILIGINQQLNSDNLEIGENSIHKQLIETHKDADKIIELFQRQREIHSCANMGHYFLLPGGKKNYYFLVMSTMPSVRTPLTAKENLQKALKNFFDHQQSLQRANGCLYIPLLGTGDSDIDMTRTEVAKLIINEYILSFNRKTEQRTNRIKTLELVIYYKDFFKGDLLRNWWQFRQDVLAMTKLCNDCCQIDYLSSESGDS